MLVILGSIVGACIVVLKRPPELPPAEYDRQVAKMDKDRLAQIETASSPEELDDIENRWNEAMSQIRRGKE